MLASIPLVRREILSKDGHTVCDFLPANEYKANSTRRSLPVSRSSKSAAVGITSICIGGPPSWHCEIFGRSSNRWALITTPILAWHCSGSPDTALAAADFCYSRAVLFTLAVANFCALGPVSDQWRFTGADNVLPFDNGFLMEFRNMSIYPPTNYDLFAHGPSSSQGPSGQSSRQASRLVSFRSRLAVAKPQRRRSKATCLRYPTLVLQASAKALR